MAIIFGDGEEVIADGVCEGEITSAPAGSNGFGYDPVFYVPAFKCTMAELDSAQKNSVSHRGIAVRRMLREIKNRYVL